MYEITCGKFEGGEIAYGDLLETGLPDAPKKDDCSELTINGHKYRLVEE